MTDNTARIDVLNERITFLNDLKDRLNSTTAQHVAELDTKIVECNTQIAAYQAADLEPNVSAVPAPAVDTTPAVTPTPEAAPVTPVPEATTEVQPEATTEVEPTPTPEATPTADETPAQ